MRNSKISTAAVRGRHVCSRRVRRRNTGTTVLPPGWFPLTANFIPPNGSGRTPPPLTLSYKIIHNRNTYRRPSVAPYRLGRYILWGVYTTSGFFFDYVSCVPRVRRQRPGRHRGAEVFPSMRSGTILARGSFAAAPFSDGPRSVALRNINTDILFLKARSRLRRTYYY